MSTIAPKTSGETDELRYVNMFKEMDMDNNGSVDRAELAEGLKRLGMDSSESLVRTLLQQFGQGKPRLDQAAFVDLAKYLQSVQSYEMLFDGDGDGEISKLERLLMKYDVDKSGTFSVAEVKAIVVDLDKEEKKGKSLKKVIAGLVVGLVGVVCALLVIVVMANELSKENHTVGGTMVTNNEAVQVGLIESTMTIWDVPAVPTNTLAKMNDLVFYADLTTLAQVGSWVEMSAKIGRSYKADANKVFLTTYSGDTIAIDREAKSGTIEIDGTAYPISDALPARSRRLNTVASTPPKMTPGGRRELFGFGGMMTSGSTMAQSSGF